MENKHMHKIKQYVSTLLLGLSLSFSSVPPAVLPISVGAGAVVLTACKDSDIDKAAKVSRELAGDIVTAEKVVATAFTGGLITLAKKDEMAVHFKSISVAGTSYNDLVKDFSERAKNGTLPANALALLSSEFDKIVTPFLKLLDDIGKLSPAANTQISLGLAALKAGVVALAAIMAKRGSKTAKENVRQLNLRGVYA